MVVFGANGAKRCGAPWYELNISAPENYASACCYYAGEKPEWSDQPKTLDDYWNSPALRALRRLQADPSPPAHHGCSDCYWYKNAPPGVEIYDLSPEHPPVGLSELQAANWRLAKAEYVAGAEIVASRPLRVLANFGFACNLSCTMCHQVPRRLDIRRQLSADHLLSWADDLERAIDVCLVGGEPFTLPQAVKFMRKFVSMERFEPVRLQITTNGTVLHKHWEMLYRKKRLTFGISIDGIGETYERVRLGGRWNDVERNILRVRETRAKDRPEWAMATVANIYKSSLPDLPNFAKWHVRHDVQSYFYNFIATPGAEETFYRENFRDNPELLADMPEWREHFDAAIEVYEQAGERPEGVRPEIGFLKHFKGQVEQSLARAAIRILPDARRNNDAAGIRCRVRAGDHRYR